MRFVIATLCIATFATTAFATEHALAPVPGGDPPQQNIVLNTWAFPNCDAMGIDYVSSDGVVWCADQGTDCEPMGQIFTFDTTTGLFNLEFAVSTVTGFAELSANGIEVVGDHVYIADFNGDVTNFDDCIHKFTKTGNYVTTYDLSYALDTVVGLGYLDGVFYATTTTSEVFGFTENVGAGTMDLVLSTVITGVSAGGGGLDWDEECLNWLHVDFRNVPPEVYVLDATFTVIGSYDAETTNPIGVTYGPNFAGLETWYVASRDDFFIYKTDDHNVVPCETTPVEQTTWGKVKGMYQ